MAEIKKEQPQLPDEWPELRKAKASAKTAWAYYSDLVKLLGWSPNRLELARCYHQR